MSNSIARICSLGALALTLIGATEACSGSDDSGGGGGGDGGGGGADAATGGTPSGGSGGESANGGAGGTGGAGAAGGAATGGADSGAGDAGSCGATDTCSCASNESCNFACDGCTAQCLGPASRCTADCTGGGCTLDADNESVAAFSCDGGGCTSDCDNGSECTVDCAGGGCNVTCDVGSHCTVICPAGGPDCNVTCENGGLATCTGACVLTGCEVCDPSTPDTSYAPTIDPSNFSTTIDNPYFPLPVGAIWTYEEAGPPDLIIIVEVTAQTKTVAMGVECVVVHDHVHIKNADGSPGDLIEDTWDWYAQDADGNVWYFGEDTAEYVNGQVANRNGTWEAGVDGALPGIIMEASPTVGDRYYQEYLVCQAEDEGEVVDLAASVTVPYGSYTGCLQTRDFTDLDPLGDALKTYCSGIGLVGETDPDGNPTEQLVDVTGLP